VFDGRRYWKATRLEDDTCNAFFDPNEHTLNFFKAGDGCANSAYCDVACLEFGHAVDDQLGEILDGG
jgi:hypothetical protein